MLAWLQLGSRPVLRFGALVFRKKKKWHPCKTSGQIDNEDSLRRLRFSSRVDCDFTVKDAASINSDVWMFMGKKNHEWEYVFHYNHICLHDNCHHIFISNLSKYILVSTTDQDAHLHTPTHLFHHILSINAPRKEFFFALKYQNCDSLLKLRWKAIFTCLNCWAYRALTTQGKFELSLSAAYISAVNTITGTYVKGKSHACDYLWVSKQQ